MANFWKRWFYNASFCLHNFGRFDTMTLVGRLKKWWDKKRPTKGCSDGSDLEGANNFATGVIGLNEKTL